MANSRHKPQTGKRLQALVDQTIAVLAKLVRPLFQLIVFFCVALVVCSAWSIHEVLGWVAIVGAIFAITIVGGLQFLIHFGKVTISIHGEKRPLEMVTPVYMLLLFCGFFQILFWVIDHTNSIHEPRSVFILAVAGGVAYIRQQVSKEPSKLPVRASRRTSRKS